MSKVKKNADILTRNHSNFNLINNKNNYKYN
jgi:hypothetical protein